MTQSDNYAVVFPGQGSQSVGMLAEIADQHAVVRETFQQASDTLGADLWTLSQAGPEDKLKETEVTQPLMFTSGVALWRVWTAVAEQHPVVLAGHSLGEFCALVAGGSLSFEDGITLVQTRARLMAGAVEAGEGGMAAILGMEDDAVVALCDSVNGARVVEAVNFNSTGQVAISGHTDAVQAVLDKAPEAGAKKAVMLPVSVPNHSSLMRPAGEQLVKAIDELDFAELSIPVMQNTHATVPASVDAMLKSLKDHVFSPVYWTTAYRNMLESFSIKTVVELGPGKVLAGLGKRIERSVPVMPVDSPATLEKALQKLFSPESS